jgi:NADH-quinone oxidoreductase subunit H
MGFALFFLAEYSSMILMSCLTSIVFLGGWVSVSFFFFDTLSLFLSLKICLILFFFIWVRASFPRYRIDQLMRLCWKVFLPLSLAFVIFIICSICFTNSLF